MSNTSNTDGTLHSLKIQAQIDLNTSNDYPIRAWITSAKKCFDQAEEDVKAGDIDAAYVNYVRATSIVAEVIPRHRGMSELEGRRTSLAQDYWAFRSRVSLAFGRVEKLQQQIEARERESHSYIASAGGVPSNSLISAQGTGGSIAESARSNSPHTVSTKQASGSTLKIPRKRLGTPAISDKAASPPLNNGNTSRPSSTSSSDKGSIRQSIQLNEPNPVRQEIAFPKANVIEPELLLSYLRLPESTRPYILILDVRPKELYECGCLNAPNVVWIDPILLDEEKSGKKLEESLVLLPPQQQDWFANRHLFDLVVIYDEDSRVNSYAGGPIQDIHQARLRNLGVAIFDYAGYLKPLKHVPMLLVGGIRAWCKCVPDRPLRRAELPLSKVAQPHPPSLNPATRANGPRQYGTAIDRDLSELDLDAESRWIESLQSDPFLLFSYGSDGRNNIQVLSPVLDGVDKKKLNRSVVISSSSSIDPYNKSLLDFFQKFPSVEPESMSGAPRGYSRPNSVGPPRLGAIQTNIEPIPQPSPRRQSTFIDHPFHGFTEVKNPDFQPPTPSKKTADPRYDSQDLVPSPSLGPGEDEQYSSGRTRIPSIGSQISQVGPVSAGMTGLKNLGNTCYMNSVLQCMSATTPLARYFLSGSYRRSINADNPLGSKGVLANTFAELIKHLWSDQYTHISPVSLRTVVGKLQHRFKNSDQQDAQDFLAFFLDGLHEDLNENALKSKLRELTPDEERRRERMPLAEISNIEWDRYKHNHKSFLVELFQGQFVSCLKCSVCGQTSTTCNAFMNLSVEISLPHGSQGLKLTQCIDAFLKEEVLEGDDAWNCPKCQKPQRATKQLKIARLPPILIIHLKRFHYAGPWRDKLNTFVDYPLENLDLTKHVLSGRMASDSQQNQLPEKYLYDLYGVTNHFGTLSGGHYTAFIHNKLRGKWYVFDDSRVSPCDDSSVVGRAAYILWYKRSNQF